MRSKKEKSERKRKREDSIEKSTPLFELFSNQEHREPHEYFYVKRQFKY